MDASQDTSEVSLTWWIAQLRSKARTERLRARALILRQGKAAVLPLIATYARTEDEQVRIRIINILALLGEEAIDILIQQLVEGDLRRQECARRTLPRITSSLLKLMQLTHKNTDLTNEIQAILHKLAMNLGYPSVGQLMANCQKSIQREPLQVNEIPSHDLQIQRIITSLDDAQKCLAADLYLQAFVTCDQVVQQLLMTLLEFFRIDLGKDTNKLRTVLTALRKQGVLIKSEQKLRWLRSTRNLIRYKQKRATRREANHALRKAQFFAQEVKWLLKLQS